MPTIHELRRGMAPHLGPIRLLWAINKLGAQRMQQLHARTQLCLVQHRAIAVMAEAGKVAVVWSGRDCDGVAYSGDVRLVDAVLAELRRHTGIKKSGPTAPAATPSCRPRRRH